jgi:hypothetical protein
VKPIFERVFKLEAKLQNKPYESYSRINSEIELWRDLFTDVRPYNSEFESTEGDDYLDGLTRYPEQIRDLPKHIVMFGWFDLLEMTEMPTNDFSWTIISAKMLKVVKHLGFTDYNLINLRVIERSQFNNIYGENPRDYEDENAVKNLIYNDEMFYGFQVLPRIPLLTDDSDIRTNKIFWREDITELPHFFLDGKFTGQLMVNQEARDALEKAGIRGIEFLSAFE